MSTKIDLPALAHAYRRLVLWFGVHLLASLPTNYWTIMRDVAAAETTEATPPSLASFILTLGGLVVLLALLSH